MNVTEMSLNICLFSTECVRTNGVNGFSTWLQCKRSGIRLIITFFPEQNISNCNQFGKTVFIMRVQNEVDWKQFVSNNEGNTNSDNNSTEENIN